jgi:uncharacterized protein with FMN-binding domain
MTRRWQGTALFAVIIAALSATVAGRLLAPAADAAAAAGAGGGTAGTGSTTSGATSGGDTITGDVEQTRFGAVQVSVSFNGSKITGVTVLQAPSESGRDQMLTQMATPQLEQEVVASQSARVDTVSGATYTSEGYLASVQSAIDAHS